MHVICDCAVALTETFEDVDVEASQKVTVHSGYVRSNRLGIHGAFSSWKHFCPPTLLLGQVQGTIIFPSLFLLPLFLPTLSSSGQLQLQLFSPSLYCLMYHPLLHQPSTPISKFVSLSLSQHSPLTCMISALKLLTCELHYPCMSFLIYFSFNQWF